MSKISILNVKFDSITFKNALKQVEKYLKSSDFHYIVTPNPEFLVYAHRNPTFKQILNDADLSIPDSKGIMLAANYLKTPLPERIPGTDFISQLFPILQKNHQKVFLLGGQQDVAGLMKQLLEKEYPDINVVGAETGPQWRSNDTLAAPAQEMIDLVARIKASQADLLLVAFGAPKQEKFIYRFRHHLGVKAAIGVGGALDYISGVVPRAPEWLRRLGLEWLYRLFAQPSRARRIFRSVIIFPYLILTNSKKSSN